MDLFPAGQRQLRVVLPAFVLIVSANDVLSNTDVTAKIDEAAGSGLTAVLLWDAGTSSAGDLFEAACKLKELLRERSLLLVLDRTDIATAAGAEGVILSPNGVPVVVARRMMPASTALVGSLARTAEAAVTAAADGANLVLLEAADGDFPSADTLAQARSGQRSGNPIPVLPCSTTQMSPSRLQQLLPAAADGMAMPHWALGDAAAACGANDGGAAEMVAALLGSVKSGKADAVQAPATALPKAREQQSIQGLLSPEVQALLGVEKDVLGKVATLVEEVCPSMGEVSLLKDALGSLDDPFMVVVVGEFNSGKSSVINALLGGKFLAEGVLPTTNEISVLRYAGDDAPSEQQSDGYVVRYLPAELLRELSVVDTPGTNVILERQQRLTEEYVPRADLVLFVISVDRPFTESEVTFLEYIRRWKKKVVFVLNKADMLKDPTDLEAVTGFVRDNARRLLQLDSPVVLPVSARKALRAKTHVGRGLTGVIDHGDLSVNTDWQKSQFGQLESFLVQFLVGKRPDTPAGEAAVEDEEGGGAGVRLKLLTPLNIADAFMDAMRKVLERELEAAREDLDGVRSVAAQMERFQREMERDGAVQRVSCGNLVRTAQAKMEDYVDRTLTLSNMPKLLGSIMGLGTPAKLGEATDAVLRREVVGDAALQLRDAVSEHANWLDTNVRNQLQQYRNMVLAAEVELPADQSAALEEANKATGTELATRDSVTAAEALDLKAASVLLEQEFKEAVLGTAGAAAGAQGLGLVSASVLATTLEDLLALSVAGAASYIAVLNLPLRRAEIKGKLQRVAGNFVGEVDKAMERELVEAVGGCVATVLRLVEPLEEKYAAEVQRLEAAEGRRRRLEAQMEDLQSKIANL